MAVSVVELVDHVAEGSSLLGSYTISAFVNHNIAEVVNLQDITVIACARIRTVGRVGLTTKQGTIVFIS